MCTPRTTFNGIQCSPKSYSNTLINLGAYVAPVLFPFGHYLKTFSLGRASACDVMNSRTCFLSGGAYILFEVLSYPYPLPQTVNMVFKQLLLLTFVLTLFATICNASFHNPIDLESDIYHVIKDESSAELFTPFSPYL